MAERSEEFSDGFARVRSPHFQSVQQQSNHNFQNTSVLDNLRPNQNGLGQSDLQRRLMGIGSSAIGSSDQTFEQHLWLRNREPSQRAKTLDEGN